MTQPRRGTPHPIPSLVALAVLLVAPAARADVTVSDPWEIGITGTGSWAYTEASGAWSLQRVSRAEHPEQVRHGDYALRIEVRPGDDPIDSSGERAEVSHLRFTGTRTELFETRTSGTQFYAFSVKLDPSWQPPDGSNDWGIVFQLHSPWNTSPSFAFAAEDVFRVTGQVGNVAGSRDTPSGWSYVSYDLDPSERALALGVWIDFVIEITWAHDTTGAITVWRRDEGETDFARALALTSIRTLQHMDGADANHYWKHGFYRSASDHTNILWLDGLTRADSYDEAVAGAFGAGTTTPPDFTNASIANATNLTASSDDLAVAHEIENLFDSCLSDADGCTAGTDASESLWAEFDLGRPHALSSARLHGDANGTWVSRAWTLETRLDPGAPWEPAFSSRPATESAWTAETLDDRAARYLRVTIEGAPGSGAVQARELEILGTSIEGPVDAGVDADAGALDRDAGTSSGTDAGAIRRTDAGTEMTADAGSIDPPASAGCSIGRPVGSSLVLSAIAGCCFAMLGRRTRRRRAS